MEKLAVITGDLVRSRAIENIDRENIILVLSGIYNQIIEKICMEGLQEKLEFFRGDSFQTIVEEPKYALRIAILLRAKLRSISRGKQKTSSQKISLPLSNIWDFRFGIGVGEISFISKQTIASDGTAFILSGSALDQIKDKGERMRVKTQDANFDEEFYIHLLLADAIIKKWTVTQSEAAFQYLLNPNKTQVELAKILKINQSALSRRIQSGNIDIIHYLCQRYEALIPKL